ncbi:MAG: DUF6785 family protein [Planctomycetota bacterium]|jgi:hypothetical protein
MTIRAVILGFLGAIFVASVAFINDHVWLLPQFVSSHFPIFVFGSLVLLVLAINPLMFLLGRSWRLKPGEISVAMLLMLVSCSIPSWGFLGAFTRTMVSPAQVYDRRPGWQKNNLLQYVPPNMLPAEGKYVPEFTDSILRGEGTPEQPLSMADVSWHYWQEPLLTWLPLVVLMAIAVMCLGLVLHRQWSTAERLRYPIADVATSLLGQDPNRATAPLFRNSMFWTGFSIVLFIRVVNGLHAWFPNDMIEIPLQLPFYDIALKYRVIMEADMWWWAWLGPVLYPSVIAIAFMLASDVGLSLGIAPVLFAAVSLAFLRTSGLNIGKDDYMLGGPSAFQRFGSYLAMAFMIAYTGRRYYWDVLTSALSFRRRGDVENYAAWACRILILSLIGVVAILSSLGLALPFAILCVGLILLIFLGMSRINCESGLFLNLPRWQPIGVLVGLFGATALGPDAVMIVAILSVVFTVAPWECLMPFFMNGMRMCSNQNIKPSRAGATAIGGYLVAMAVAVPVVLWAAQNFGVKGQADMWSTETLPKYYYESTDHKVNDLKNEAELTRSKEMTGSERFTLAGERLLERIKSLDDMFLWAVFLGAGAVLVVGVMRLRLPWWPLHPVLFMVWGTRQMAELSCSFLLGWLIKSIVTNLGGSRAYQRTKTLMFGIIGGDLLGGLIFMVIGLIYHIVTNKAAPAYDIFPLMR